MTREELKAHCERHVQQFERVEKIMPVTPNDWKRYEEHKLILELLEQEPCEDCVSRQAVLDLVNSDWEYEGLEVPIDSLPSVKPACKKSKWITKCHGYPPEPTAVCLKCGFDRDFYIRTIGFDKIKYCPNCGRKMEE